MARGVPNLRVRRCWLARLFRRHPSSAVGAVLLATTFTHNSRVEQGAQGVGMHTGRSACSRTDSAMSTRATPSRVASIANVVLLVHGSGSGSGSICGATHGGLAVERSTGRGPRR